MSPSSLGAAPCYGGTSAKSTNPGPLAAASPAVFHARNGDLAGLASGKALRYHEAVKDLLHHLWLPLLLVVIAAPADGQAPGPGLDPRLLYRVVITEVMVSPRALATAQGQWIEIWNPSKEPVDLQGMVLRTASGGFHPLSPSQAMRLDPGAFLVLGPMTGKPAEGSAPVQYAYGGDLPMSASGDVLWISLKDSLVDLVSWGPESLPVEPGRSLSREPLDPFSGEPADWCAGRDPYEGGPDLGTPGQPNPWCDSDGDGLAEDQGDCDDRNADVRPGAVEQCNGLDDDCNDRIDDDPTGPDRVCPSLGVCRGMQARCAGASGWVCAFPDSYEPVETRCDGLDNDCDGETDEGFFWNGIPLKAPCQSPGVCGTGQVVCRSDTSGAICSTDPEGPDSPASPEACNGLDDDCDGETDEDYPVGRDCESGTGLCRASGIWRCSSDGWTVTCDAAHPDPVPEVCGNGLDDDCDGETDEGFPVGDVCQDGQGACRVFGKWACSPDGAGVLCLAQPGEPGREVCGNRIDDDCDGETDEPDCLAPGSGTGCAMAGRPSGHALLPWILPVLVLLRSRHRAAAWRRR